MDPEIKINELRRKKIITMKVSQRFFIVNDCFAIFARSVRI